MWHRMMERINTGYFVVDILLRGGMLSMKINIYNMCTSIESYY